MGESLVDTYVHDVISRQEVTKRIDIGMSLGRFHDYKEHEGNFYKNVVQAHALCNVCSRTKQNSKELENIIYVLTNSFINVRDAFI